MHIKVGHHRPTCETPSKWRSAGGPIVARDCFQAGMLALLIYDQCMDIYVTRHAKRDELGVI